MSTTDLPGWMVLLEDAGLVNADMFRTALREAEDDARRAGSWLVDHGYVGQRDLALVQAEDHGLPFVEPGDFRVHLENKVLITEELARTLNVFPLFVLDRIITLAVVWPLELPTLDQIRLHTSCEVDQCLVSPREMRNLIEWAYGGFHGQAAARSAEAVAWEEILKDVADAPAVKLVNVLLDQAVGSQASDVHIDAEEQSLRVRFRIDGMLREVPAPPKDLLPAIVSRIKVLAHMDIAETRKPQDGHFKLAVERQELDIRVSTLPSANGEAVVLRLLHGAGHLLSLEDLGMDARTRAAFDRLIHLPHGMLLVTGPTGSGKTTTLYSAIARLDRVRQSIITLEDPVEIRLPQMRQVAVNPKAGLTFRTGLRAILRQDPDIIMIGEIRDRETAETALQAALTGHLMLSTLHTNSAAAVPARLLDMGVPDFLVTSALVGVLAQRLCRRVCQHCVRPVDDLAATLELLSPDVVAALEGGKLFQAMGCKRCGNTGYEGRVGIFELLVISDDLRRNINAGIDERALVALARQNGMRLLCEDGLVKVRQGLTTVQELLRVTGRIEIGADFAASEEPAETSRPATPASGLSRSKPGPRTGFNIDAYENLLQRWLRPSGDRLRTATAGIGEVHSSEGN
ncbi:MAG: type II/IV secretion system protein [Phycisphaerae bacterium]|nr:type II/IV secretion system protein [Phycisphaerae bacterium]